jgi:hypothetical protein
MKLKFLLWVFVILTLCSLASAVELPYYACNQSSYDNYEAINYNSDYGQEAIEFPFVMNGTINITKISMSLYKAGNPTGYVYCQIMNSTKKSQMLKNSSLVGVGNITSGDYTAPNHINFTFNYVVPTNMNFSITCDGTYVTSTTDRIDIAVKNSGNYCNSRWYIVTKAQIGGDTWDTGVRTLMSAWTIWYENVYVASAPTITPTYPYNGTYNDTYNNYNGWINFTTEVNSSCSINDSRWNMVLGNGTSWAYYNSTPSSFESGFYSINASCNNTENQIKATKKTLYFYIDTVIPTILANFSTGTYLKTLSNYSMQFNLSDNILLWGWNFTINNVRVNWTQNMQVSSIRFNTSNSSWVIGKNNLSLELFDAHTALETDIKTSEIAKVSDALKVRDTTATSLSTVDKITYVKELDKYTFCYYYKDPITTAQIRMSDNCYYQNREDLYSGWFVCGMEWWDFNNKDNYKVSVKDNIITAISEKPTDKFCFNSVGSLNSYTANYTLWGFNDTKTYTANTLEGITNKFTLTLWSENLTFTSAANLNYNNTFYNLTEVNGTNYRNYSVDITAPTMPTGSVNINKTFWFNFTINDGVYNTTPANQTVSNFIIENCTNYNVHAINFTFYNTTSGVNTISNATMTGYFSTANYGNFNLSWGLLGNLSVCINPNYASDSITMQLQYTVDGCAVRNYYSTLNLDNVTDFINLYCEKAASAVTFTVKDQDDNNVPNIYIYIQKYDVGTDTATTTEIIKTNSNGQSIGNIIKTTQLYKFILVYGGAIVLETSETYILLDTYTFRINLETDYFSNYDIIHNAYCSKPSYTNATTTFSYTYLDSSSNVTQGCMDIYITSNTGSHIVNTSCNTGSSGTINLKIPEPFGTNSYYATGYIYIGSEKFVCSDSESVIFDVGWKDYGTESLFLSFLLLVFLITVGLWSPIVAIALMIIGIVLLNILGLFHLSYGWLIGFVILGGIVMYKMRQT